MFGILLILSTLQLFAVAGLISLLSFFIKEKKVAGIVGIISLALSFISSAYILYYILETGVKTTYSLTDYDAIGVSLSFILDPYSGIMMALVSFLSLIIGIYSYYYMQEDEGFVRYFIYYTFFVGSMMLVVSSNNLLILFFGWEGTGLASYALIGHWRHDEKERMIGEDGHYVKNTPMFSFPTTSGLRALIFTRLPDLLMLIGIFIVYQFTNTFEIDKIFAMAPQLITKLFTHGILNIVMFLLSIGALAKSAQFPFHEWLVTAMTGPTPVSALIHAATMVKAGVYYMLRISPIFIYGAKQLVETGSPLSALIIQQINGFYYALFFIGALTAFSLGSMALVAREAKLILAYSTGSQLGFMFAGIGASAFSLEPSLVLTFVLAHLISHAIFKAGLFLGAGILIHEGESRFVDEWPNIYTMKKTTSALWILTLSLAGVPPLIGFWTKDSLVEGYISTGLILPTSMLVITILFTAFYSTRFLLFNYKYNKGTQKLHEPPNYVLSTYSALAILSIVLGLSWPLIAESFVSFASSSFVEQITEYTTEISSATYLSLGIVSIGILLSLSSYVINIINSREISNTMKPITEFLRDRWLLNVVYYNLGIALLNFGKMVYLFIEKKLDAIIDIRIPKAVGVISSHLRRLQSGSVYDFIFYFILSAFIILLIVAVW